jgi:cell division inhibitor SepF
MAIWKRAMDYLGLGPDDAYDDYDLPPESERPVRQTRLRDFDQPRRDSRQVPPDDFDGSVRTLPSRPSFPTREPDYTGRRPLPPSDESSLQVRPIPGSGTRAQQQPRVNVPPVSNEPHTVRPRRFDSAQEVADKFKDGQPVIMNLEGADREVSRRLIDFASGLCYALNGTMEKVASGVYLLKPVQQRVTFDNDFES